MRRPPPPRLPPSPLAAYVAPLGEVSPTDAPAQGAPQASTQGSGRFWFYLAFGGITLALGAALLKSHKTIEAQREEIEDLLSEQDLGAPKVERMTFRKAPRDPFEEPSFGSMFF